MPPTRSNAPRARRTAGPPIVDASLAPLLARSPALAAAVRRTRVPVRLFHYTSAATLPAIVGGVAFECRERGRGDPADGEPLPMMRATHLRFMNDRSELKLATGLMTAELERHAARGARRALLAARDALQSLSDEPWIWAVSWSEHGNQLSQWRAYAGGVGGFSVGVPVGHLRRMAAWQGFVLVPCIYREELQRRIAQEAVARWAAGDGRRADAHEARRFARDLLAIGATMKHPGFVEEREWRLILRADPPDARIAYRPRPRFHATAYGLASWVPFWLREGRSDRMRGLRIVAGPTDDVEGALASTRALLDAVPGIDGAVEASGIPLRR